MKVDLKTKTAEDGSNYLAVNPKGYVPALQLDDGQILTEGPAIVQYLADKVPASNLAPANGTMERYRLQEWLNFISTELHKQFSNFFNPACSEEMKEATKKKLTGRYVHIGEKLGSQDYITGKNFTVADAYLFVTLRWAQKFEIPLPANVKAYFDRVIARPKVLEALKVQGLA